MHRGLPAAITVPTPGTKVPLVSGYTPCDGFSITAIETNVGKITVYARPLTGSTQVAVYVLPVPAAGQPLPSLTVSSNRHSSFDLSEYSVDAASANDGVRVSLML